MLKSLSTSLIARSILAVIIGIIALAWPGVTVLALVILFAVYAFMASGMEAARGFSSRKAGPVIGHLLLGLVDLTAGMVALMWPGPTALVLVLVVGVWADLRGHPLFCDLQPGRADQVDSAQRAPSDRSRWWCQGRVGFLGGPGAAGPVWFPPLGDGLVLRPSRRRSG
jgi:hypothetical protein